MTARPLISLAAAAVLLLGAAAETAHATAPGRNGPIVFRRYLGPDRTLGAIFTIAPDGTAERQVTSPPAGFSDDFPDYAADGSLIAFHRCADFCRIFTVRPDGTAARPVGPGCAPGQTPPKCIETSYTALSPDVKWIAFEGGWGRLDDEGLDHQDIFVARIDGTHLRRITFSRKRQEVYGQPQWSPDGRRLLFVRYEVDGSQAIFTANRRGSDVHRVTPWSLHAGDGPDWSPDGSRILFRSPENDDFLNSNLFTIRVDGGGLRQITHVAPATKLYSSSFSPDGRSITFAMLGVGGFPDVFRMNADGSGVTPVTQTAAYDSAPDWGGVR